MALQITVTDSPQRVDAAARIWAETTAARDGDEDVAPLELARPLIQAVLDSSPRSMLLVADEDGQTIGFAAMQPWGRAREDAAIAEVRYVGVSPRVWGTGAGRQLMAAVRDALAKAGYEQAVLTVYIDNTRAVRLYEGLGWRVQGAPAPHPRSGRLEQQYVLDVVR
ncbi:GNAT family N-acetyltransferase [Dactylosporangium sp. NPDC051484]|uniref:GNAT family N-acetyltransferase n=1 Tax=Dactylosporangium sp. NPDC051484 TaxID=3154942 RepID=UPI00344EE589